MKTPVAWRLDRGPLYHDVRVASALLEQGLPEAAWSGRAQNEVWRNIAARTSTPAQRPWLPVVAYAGWAVAAVSVVALLVTSLSLRAPPSAIATHPAPTQVAFDDRTATWEPVSLGSEGRLMVKPQSRLELTAGQALTPGANATGQARRIFLREGELCAQVTHRDVPHQGPLIVESPQMKVVVIGTKFCLATAAGVARVNVTEGRVRVETSAGMSTEVGAGEAIRSDDVRLRAAIAEPSFVPMAPTSGVAPQSALPNVAGCAGLRGVDERARCYRRIADGSGLAAQNALYGLGLIARDHLHDRQAALHYWTDYAERFPHGVLAPEAALGILGALIADRRYAEAIDAADRYLQLSPDGLGAEVTLAKAEILQTGLNSPDSAIPIYLGLLSGELSSPVRQEVLYSMGLCEQREGYPTQAEQLWKRYLSSFPRGPHSAQVAGLLRDR